MYPPPHVTCILLLMMILMIMIMIMIIIMRMTTRTPTPTTIKVRGRGHLRRTIRGRQGHRPGGAWARMSGLRSQIISALHLAAAANVAEMEAAVAERPQFVSTVRPLGLSARMKANLGSHTITDRF